MRVLLSPFALFLMLLVHAAPAPAWETRIDPSFYGGGAMRVVFDPAGNVVAGGYTHESGDLAIATVVKLAPDGAVLWRTDVDPLGSFIVSVYADPAGDVLVQGCPKAPRVRSAPPVIGNAVNIMRIATGEVEDVKPDPAKEPMRRGGLAGGKARAKALNPTKRRRSRRRRAGALGALASRP